MAISNEIHEIPLDQIRVSKLNVRKTDKRVGIEELADSIKKHGLLQPVVLNGKLGKLPYELIVGQRRFYAHQFLGEKNIRAVFIEEENPLQLKMLSFLENVHRAELNYADKAEAITYLYKEFGRDANKVARELGLSVSTIIEYVKLEEQTTPEVKKLIKERKLRKADVKRAITAGQGDTKTISILLNELPKLTKYEKDRAVEYGRKQKATAEQIIEEAKKPKFERTVILNLDEDTDNALSKAGEELFMDREKIAEMALEKWLKENGFLK